jgi:hypothetical protein
MVISFKNHAEPVARLENIGEQNCYVIDFPQMISTNIKRKGVIQRDLLGVYAGSLNSVCTIPDHLTAGTCMGIL